MESSEERPRQRPAEHSTEVLLHCRRPLLFALIASSFLNSKVNPYIPPMLLFDQWIWVLPPQREADRPIGLCPNVRSIVWAFILSFFLLLACAAFPWSVYDYLTERICDGVLVYVFVLFVVHRFDPWSFLMREISFRRQRDLELWHHDRIRILKNLA